MGLKNTLSRYFNRRTAIPAVFTLLNVFFAVAAIQHKNPVGFAISSSLGAWSAYTWKRAMREPPGMQ